MTCYGLVCIPQQLYTCFAPILLSCILFFILGFFSYFDFMQLTRIHRATETMDVGCWPSVCLAHLKPTNLPLAQTKPFLLNISTYLQICTNRQSPTQSFDQDSNFFTNKSSSCFPFPLPAVLLENLLVLMILQGTFFIPLSLNAENQFSIPFRTIPSFDLFVKSSLSLSQYPWLLCSDIIV